MESKLESLSKEVLNYKLNGIPEKYRQEFIKLIKETQEEIKHKSYQSNSGEGLISLTIKNDGTIKDLKLDDILINNKSEI